MKIVDYQGLFPKARPPTKKETKLFKRWVSYLKDTLLSEEEKYRRAEKFTNEGRKPDVW